MTIDRIKQIFKSTEPKGCYVSFEGERYWLYSLYHDPQTHKLSDDIVRLSRGLKQAYVNAPISELTELEEEQR